MWQNDGVQARIADIVNVEEPHGSEKNSTEALQDSTTKLKSLDSVRNGNRLAGSPLPQAIVSNSCNDKGQTGVLDPKLKEKPDRPGPNFLPVEDQDCKRKRKEEELQAKKAERERWRRSEQEFSLLPLQEQTAKARSETSSQPTSVTSFRSKAYSLESVQSITDRELALHLQAQLAKEIEEEDAKKALEIGMALHRECEAEKLGEADEQHLDRIEK